MKLKQFDTLENCFECYGRGNLVAIDNLKQVILYCQMGVQPKFVYENETKPGKMAFWYLKSESNYCYKKWLEQNKSKTNKNGE